MNDRENDLMNDRHLPEDELILHSYGDVDRVCRRPLLERHHAGHDDAASRGRC